GLAPTAPVEEGAELTIELVEVDRHDAAAAVGKLEGVDVCVGEAAELVGKKVKVKIERVLDGTVYATLSRRAKKTAEPLTAEAEAEKPTRKPPARKTPGGVETAETETDEDDEELEVLEPVAAESDVEPDEEEEPAGEEAAAGPTTPAKKKTRRGSRGGKNRKKPATAGATH